MRRFDHARLHAFIAAEVGRVEGRGWPEIAAQLGRIGRCEFEDYAPLAAVA